MDRSEDTFDPYQPSHGVAYGMVGVLLLVVGGALLANVNEAAAFGTLATVFLGAGLYLTVAGAVARGIQLSRR